MDAVVRIDVEKGVSKSQTAWSVFLGVCFIIDKIGWFAEW